jgi:hypothetical protein
MITLLPNKVRSTGKIFKFEKINKLCFERNPYAIFRVTMCHVMIISDMHDTLPHANRRLVEVGGKRKSYPCA